jgi:ubiquitin
VLPILNQVILDVFLELYPDYDRFYDSISVRVTGLPVKAEETESDEDKDENFMTEEETNDPGLRDVMQIIIKTITGKTINLDVEPADTIKDVKAKIQGEVNTPTDRQMLFNDKWVLSDNRTLSSYNIKCGFTLY